MSLSYAMSIMCTLLRRTRYNCLLSWSATTPPASAGVTWYDFFFVHRPSEPSVIERRCHGGEGPIYGIAASNRHCRT